MGTARFRRTWFWDPPRDPSAIQFEEGVVDFAQRRVRQRSWIKGDTMWWVPRRVRRRWEWLFEAWANVPVTAEWLFWADGAAVLFDGEWRPSGIRPEGPSFLRELDRLQQVGPGVAASGAFRVDLGDKVLYGETEVNDLGQLVRAASTEVGKRRPRARPPVPPVGHRVWTVLELWDHGMPMSIDLPEMPTRTSTGRQRLGLGDLRDGARELRRIRAEYYRRHPG